MSEIPIALKERQDRNKDNRHSDKPLTHPINVSSVLRMLLHQKIEKSSAAKCNGHKGHKHQCKRHCGHASNHPPVSNDRTAPR
jgi:hypothetical protein